MQPLEKITEDEMVAVFLQGEIRSTRWGTRIVELLAREGLDRRIVDTPRLDDPTENAQRRRLLGDFRGYGQNRSLFSGFPENVTWTRQSLTRDDLERIFYVEYSYWNELSAGTRKPVNGAETVRSGRLVFEQSHQLYWDLAQALKEGRRLPEMIVVGIKPSGPWVVLEGHVRLTAYFLAPDAIPAELTAIVGVSPDIGSWMQLPGPLD